MATMKLFIISILFFLSPFHLSAQRLVISEIMADPTPTIGLPDAEFVELFNASDSTIHLSGWTLFDGSIRLLPAVTISPSGYLLVCAIADTAEFTSYGAIAGVSALSLTNSGDKVAIRNPQGISTDSVIYNDTWYRDSEKMGGGWSLEKMNLEMECQLASNWSASVNPNGGTPGFTNSLNGFFEDTSSPILIHAFAIDSTQVVLVFNEPIDQSTIQLISDISLPQPHIATSVNCYDESGQKLLLKISPPIAKGMVGQLQVAEIADCSGNSIAPFASTKFGMCDSIAEGVVINEVLFNPLEGSCDFIELYHGGSKTISLMDVSIASVSLESGLWQDAVEVSPDVRFLYPGDFMVISECPESVKNQYRSSFPFGFQESRDLPSMNVDEGKVVLFHDGTPLDSIYYNEDFHFELLLDRKGVSLEKTHPDRNPMEPTTWHSASETSGGATPGLINSQFTEMGNSLHVIDLFPEIFSPDNDGYNDVITFFFKDGVPGTITNMAIYNKKGATVFTHRKNKLLSTQDYFSWNGINDSGELSPPGVYIAVVEVYTLEGETLIEKLGFVLAKNWER